MKNLLAISCTCALLFCGCGSDRVAREQQRPGSPTAPSETHILDVQSAQYVIQIGDQIQLSVWGYPEFNTVAPVKETGTITIPLLGEVSAAGLSRAQLTEQIIGKLSDYVKTKVYPTITITGALSQKVIVLGAVGVQGSLQITSPVPPFQILANAGGPSPDADLRHVKIFRNGDVSSAVDLDLSNFMSDSPHESAPIPMVNPGDMIYVPRQENLVHEFSRMLQDVVLLFGVFAIVH